MSFTRIDLLPSYDLEKKIHALDRWEDEAGTAIYKHVMDLIRKGAGEDFLQWDFEHDKLGFMKDYWDLAGMKIFSETIEFPDGDSFENIDFSYGEFWHSTFTNACFPQTHFSFARLYNVKFKDCVFHLAYFYGCHVEKCTFENCDFVEGNGFTNCDIKDTVFKDCFIYENIFKHCRFNENVKIFNTQKPLVFGLLPRALSFNESLNSDQISGIYQGIKDGFLSGEIIDMARHYLFLQHQAYTRYNSAKKFRAYLWEFAAGYGLKPPRVLALLCILFGVVFGWFMWRLGNWSTSLLLSAGAFLTFGAKADVLENLSLLDQVIYIMAAFMGVSLVALFITVLASVLLKDR
jgi:hypothetical protein